MKSNASVIAVPPSYDANSQLEVESTLSYMQYLYERGATHVMTTAGTSQFNYLSNQEIHQLNQAVSDFDGFKILGIPALSAFHITEFVKKSNDLGYIDNRTKLMALYPDRYYDDQTIYNYIKRISDIVEERIYVHAQKMRNAISGDWNYQADILNKLYDDGYICGLREEHSNLQSAYDFVSCLNKEMHIIVAGGSMRRYQYLESAGANSLLSGIGNIEPQIESKCIASHNYRRNKILDLEAKIVKVFMGYGWHKSLRESLRQIGITCWSNRQPWPDPCRQFMTDISETLNLLFEERELI